MSAHGAATWVPPAWQPDVIVDARGVLCPEPIFRLARAARDLGAGLIALAADDPAAETDVPAWCSMRSARLLAVRQEDRHTAYLVQVSSQASGSTSA